MASTVRQPRLAVIVANAITGDSRVQKTAIAAARDGWHVTLIGSTPRERIERSWLGPIEVIRVPVQGHVRRHVAGLHGHRLRRAVTQFGIADRDTLRRHRAVHEAWLRRQTAALGKPGLALSPDKVIRRASIAARHAAHRLRDKAWGWEEFRRPRPAPVTSDWRLDFPYLTDLDLAFGPLIESLEPDVIHANDITMIVTAALSARRLRAAGVRCSWIYDAHEYVAGVRWPTPLQASGCRQAEREFIGEADAVVTVSPKIAEILRRDYRLPTLPLVVGNCAVRETSAAADLNTSVRQACGLPEDAPLMVYSGWLDAERGIDVAVAGLAQLPGFHLALVSGTTSPTLTDLLQTAEHLGVRDRVHVVPYVSQHHVAAYLSAADIGLICSRRNPNCMLSLPTKMSEYLHAGLPLVTSDVDAVREFMQEHQIGAVFAAGDVDSFAHAAAHVFADRVACAERITESMLKTLSWEEQAPPLLQLYRQLSGSRLVPAEVAWTVRETGAPSAAKAGAQTSPSPHRPWRPLATTGIRLGVGPANYAGQAAAFARALSSTRSDVSAEVFMWTTNSPFDYPADVRVPVDQLNRLDVQVTALRRVVGRYTHLIADAFRPVFGGLHGDHIDADLSTLRQAGIAVALLAHGSEVRHPIHHLNRNPNSHFRDAPDGMVRTLTQIAEHNRRVAASCGLPIFVTTPDLLSDIPWATWAPLVVDVEAWRCDRPPMQRARPIVIHTPSRRWTKGTDRIIPIMRKLHDRGLIDFRLIEGVSWTQMRTIIHDADIVLDQFTTGSYGTLSCEAMAAGRIAVAFLDDGVTAAIGREPPIVNAAPDTLSEAIERLVSDRSEATRIGAESAAFARAYHDGTWTASVFAEFLGSP